MGVNKGSHVMLKQLVLHLLMRVRMSMLAITMRVTLMVTRCTLVPASDEDEEEEDCPTCQGAGG